MRELSNMKMPGYLHLAVRICRLLPPRALARSKRLICKAFIGGGSIAKPYRTEPSIMMQQVISRHVLQQGATSISASLIQLVKYPYLWCFLLNQIDAFNLIKHVGTPDITRIIELVQFLYKTGILRCIEKNAFKC